MSDAPRTIAVIDGNSLMHRAFHAIRQPMNAPDGRATNALFGFFSLASSTCSSRWWRPSTRTA